jgi:hypothetical protein
MLRRLAATSEDRTFHGLLDPDAEVGGLDAIRIFESSIGRSPGSRHRRCSVDDLQWVDPMSIALCHFLVRATAGSGRGLAGRGISAIASSRSLPRLAGDGAGRRIAARHPAADAAGS